MQQSAGHSTRVLRTGALLYRNQEYEVISEKREDARECMLHAMCSRGETGYMYTFTHLFTLLYLSEMSLEFLLRGGRLAGGQAECMQSIQGIGQGQQYEVGICVAGLWFSLVCKAIPFEGPRFLCCDS